MQPDATHLANQIDLTLPRIGFYDAPDPAPYEPIVAPKEGRWACAYGFFQSWLDGKTVHLTKENFGCGGAGRALCGVETRPRDEFLDFLVGEEGLKASTDLMGKWIDSNPAYRQEHPHLLIGPLRPAEYGHLKTVTFFVNPDQLSALMIGAQFHASPEDPPPVIAPFGSGCMQLVTLFRDLQAAQAVIGATDLAMRVYLPPEILAFTVTKRMFERLCSLGEESFLHKPFLTKLRQARGTLA
jgi:hypothetical protein